MLQAVKLNYRWILAIWDLRSCLNSRILELTFDLLGGQTYGNVIDDLSTGDLRIGLHVQAFANGGSESFVNNGPTSVVPTPSALLLGSIGFGIMHRIRKRKQ